MITSNLLLLHKSTASFNASIRKQHPAPVVRAKLQALLEVITGSDLWARLGLKAQACARLMEAQA